MPTAITHIVAGVSTTYLLADRREEFMLWFYIILLSVIADFDVISFSLGIPYAHTFGHRGFFHSLFFLCGISLFCMLLFYGSINKKEMNYFRMFSVFFIAAALHPLLDMLTGGGLGIGLFIPFDNTRLFFPYRPIRVSPIGINRFMTAQGLNVLKSEFFCVILPSVALVVITLLVRKTVKKPEHGPLYRQ